MSVDFLWSWARLALVAALIAVNFPREVGGVSYDAVPAGRSSIPMETPGFIELILEKPIYVLRVFCTSEQDIRALLQVLAYDNIASMTERFKQTQSCTWEIRGMCIIPVRVVDFRPVGASVVQLVEVRDCESGRIVYILNAVPPKVEFHAF